MENSNYSNKKADSKVGQAEKQCEESNFQHTWDAKAWKARFESGAAVDYRSERRKVWENTLAIVKEGGYMLPDGQSIALHSSHTMRKHSTFYYKEFCVRNSYWKRKVEITVSPGDCLDKAHEWVSQGLEVAVLNMASRRNPGGGVRNGVGAQEEYLFRCSDYFLSLYRYAPYASEYGLKQSRHQYPLDRNFGGIYSPKVTVFRGNEKSGYALLESPWRVNMIAVAGMNNPKLVLENGEARIAPELVGGVKNKIRTILRIASEQGQSNLVLGAMGCGAFHNPPRHVAELFREVLCEKEFEGGFERICFAVKTDHNSNGSANFDAFHEVLHGYVPVYHLIKMAD